MRTTPRSRRAAIIGALTATALLLILASASPAQESGSEAILSQDGWWNRLQGPQEGEPPSPVRGVIAPVPPPPNTVPADGLGVGASGGDPDKVAAIGIVLDAPADAFVDRLVLRAKETEENGSNLNAARAVVLACPVTNYWAGTKNGEWQDRPGCDDSQAVEGERANDGTWSFDLTLIAQSWVDGTLTQLGVLFIEGVEPPQSFQVSYQDIASGGVTLDFATTGGGISGSGIFMPEAEPAPAAAAPPPTSTRRPTPAPSPAPRATAAPAAPPTSAASPAPRRPRPAVPAASPDADLWGNLPFGAVVWLPLALVFAGGLALILGPMGRPDASTRRVGSVSRVLDARQRAL